jgi:hypothetical protein
MSEEQILVNAAKIGIGTAAGVATGLKNVSAPHLKGIGTGLTNLSSNFANGATKALRHHKGVAGAISAGTVAVVGHGAVAAAAVAAAPVVFAAAVAGGAILGICKLVTAVRNK